MIDKILRRLDELGMDQYELEAAAGLSPNRVTKWKKPVGEPTGAQALRIARVLKLNLEYLCDDEAEEQVVEEMSARGKVLWLAEEIGYETAIRRLTLAPESRAPAGESYGETRASNGTRREKLRNGEGT